MDLTVRYATPSNIIITYCAHCDEQIVLEDSPNFVAIKFGEMGFNLHDHCFEIFVSALLDFFTTFIKEKRLGEKTRHN